MMAKRISRPNSTQCKIWLKARKLMLNKCLKFKLVASNYSQISRKSDAISRPFKGRCACRASKYNQTKLLSLKQRLLKFKKRISNLTI